MPLYEYECKQCGHRFEQIQKFSDPLVETCPQCGGKVEQVLSAPAVQFKGSGWYVTDYARKSGSGSSAKKDAGSSGDTKPADKAEGKTEAKPEKKSSSSEKKS